MNENAPKHGTISITETAIITGSSNAFLSCGILPIAKLTVMKTKGRRSDHAQR